MKSAFFTDDSLVSGNENGVAALARPSAAPAKRRRYGPIVSIESLLSDPIHAYGHPDRPSRHTLSLCRTGVVRRAPHDVPSARELRPAADRNARPHRARA